jgi:hypothetical protein
MTPLIAAMATRMTAKTFSRRHAFFTPYHATLLT